MSKPLAIDLFCGLGGWTKGFLDEGYEVVGFDIERKPSYPGQFILQDVATISGYHLRSAFRPTVIVASPPCQAYSYRAMPWKRAKALPPPSNELFDACFRIAREAGCPLIVENVKGAQPWVGRAAWHYGSFYLWGDVPALMPQTRHVKVNGFNFHQHEKTGKPGGSFQSAAVDGIKGKDRDGYDRDHPNAFGWKSPRTSSSATEARKAASAAIAEIPYDLANWIARCFKPETAAAVRPQPFSQSPVESVPSR